MGSWEDECDGNGSGRALGYWCVQVYLRCEGLVATGRHCDCEVWAC